MWAKGVEHLAGFAFAVLHLKGTVARGTSSSRPQGRSPLSGDGEHLFQLYRVSGGSCVSHSTSSRPYFKLLLAQVRSQLKESVERGCFFSSVRWVCVITVVRSLSLKLCCGIVAFEEVYFRITFSTF